MWSLMTLLNNHGLFFKISKYLNAFGSGNSKTRLEKKQFKAVYALNNLLQALPSKRCCPWLDTMQMFILDRYRSTNCNSHSLFSSKIFSISFKTLSTTPSSICRLGIFTISSIFLFFFPVN